MNCQRRDCFDTATVRVFDTRLIVRDYCRAHAVFYWENTQPGTRVGFPIAEVVG